MQKGYQSPFIGKYLLRNKLAVCIFYCIDTLLAILFFWIKRHQNIKRPKKILISNISQIGDVAMTSALLPVIKAALPDVQIGMLVGSWASPLIQNHPLVDEVYVFNHWKLSKATRKGYFSRRKLLINQLKKASYDVVIECCYYFPSASYITFKAGIPVRIGYTSSGFGSLLTHPVQYTNRLQSASEHFAALLALVIPIDHALLRPVLPHMKSPSLSASKYIVVHMGSGNSIKEWPENEWKKVCEQLEREGNTIVFTGRGEKEAAVVAFVKQNLSQAIDLTNKISLEECIEVIRNAQLLVGVDTGVGHIAAATETPSVLLYCGINPLEHWSPKSPLAKVIMNTQPCYPCYMMNGCATMDCIRSVTVQQVLEAIQSQLEFCSSQAQKISTCHQ